MEIPKEINKHEGHGVGYMETLRTEGRLNFIDGAAVGHPEEISAAHAVQVGRLLGGVWVRCTISTCVDCHDEACELDCEHELLPIVLTGSDVMVSCEKCGAALHRD